MVTLSAVRAAAADRLATIDGLSVYASIPGAVNVPCAVVLPADDAFVVWDATTDGVDDLSLRVLLLVARAEDSLAHAQLDTYLARSGESSVKAALEPDLGGVVDYAVVTTATRFGVHQVGEISYFGCELTMSVGISVGVS